MRSSGVCCGAVDNQERRDTRSISGDKSMITLTVAGIVAVNAVAFLVSRSSLQDIDNDY